eukprot:PhM_4_TR10802/c0_g1_i1/m.9389/K01940/argG, ASS1; argininosuccinate synthase
MSSKERCMFCFTGASHGTIVIKWLQELGYEVIVFIPDVGQARDLREMQRHCQDMGCVVIVDSLQDELVQNYLYPALQAKVELGISLSAPCIAKRQTELAKMHNCRVVSHGRRGDALLQYEMIFYSLDPNITVISPWSELQFYSKFRSEDHIRTITENDTVKFQWTVQPVSTDDLLSLEVIQGSSSLGSEFLPKVLGTTPHLLDPMTIDHRAMSVPPPERLEIEFHEGLPVRVVGPDSKLTITDQLHMFSYLNNIGGKHGIGHQDMFYDESSGHKHRRVFDAPALVILYTAHEDLENLTMDREVYKLRDMFVPEYNRLAKSGMWFSPEMSFLTSALRKSQERIDGVVMVQLYAGAVQPIRRYSHAAACARNVSADAVAGYANVHALRLRAYAEQTKRRVHDVGGGGGVEIMMEERAISPVEIYS